MIPQEIGNFISVRTLGGEYRVRKEYFPNSPIRIVILKDNRILVRKISTGAVCLCSSYNEAVGIRLASMQRYNKIERMFK